MIRQSMIVLLALFASASPAAAPTQQATATDSAKKVVQNPDERICKEIDVTGIRFAKKRICATRAEWQAREQQDREAVQQMQRPLQECSLMGARKC